MTKRLSLRFALMILAIVTGILCFAVTDSQENKLDNVYAGTQTVGPVTVVTEFEYNSLTVGDYVGMFKNGWMDIYNTLDSSFVSEGGRIFCIKVYEWWNDDWDLIFDTGSDIDDPSDDVGNELYNMLPMYDYGVEYYWYSSGSWGSGYSEDIISISITPKQIDHMFDSWEFENCHYSDLDWSFMEDYWFIREHNWNYEDDDVYINWYYMDGDDEVELNDETRVGTYNIYPKLTGAHAERYVLGNMQYNNMGDFSSISKETPVEFTIEKKDIKATVSYFGNDLTMRDDGEGEVVNYISYNNCALPLTAYCKEAPTAKITIDKWRDTENYDIFADGIKDLGKYFVKTANFILDEESAKDYRIVNSNCTVEIEKRVVELSLDWNAYYTGEDVLPGYFLDVQINGGETLDYLNKPELRFSDASTVVFEYGDMGHAILELVDTTNYIIYDPMHAEYCTYIESDYYVDQGYATIEFEQIADWYYREFVANRDELAQKLNITVSTSDINEEVEIASIEWTVEANIDIWTLWTDFDYQAPNQYDLIWMDSGVAFRVTTTSSTNGKFRPTSEIYRVYLEKAPIYVRVVNTDFTYNGEYQKPDYDNYRFYIYEPDNPYCLWSEQTGLANLNELIDFVYDSELDEMVIHTWGDSWNSEAGIYNLKVVLNPAQEEFYNILINDEDFEGTIVDPGAVYEIKKAMLQVEDYEVDEFEYGTFINFSNPTFSGFIGDEDFYSADLQVKWYYNTVARYAEDEAWLNADELLYDEYPYARCDVPAGTYYIKCVVSSKNYGTITLTGEDLVVYPKELTFDWYESEDAFNIEPSSGIESDNDLSLVIAQLTYNGEAQSLFYKIWNVVNDDDVEVTTISFYEKDWTPIDSAVDVGDYLVVISAINDDNYKFPHGYSNVVARFEIVPATLTITPDSGFTKVYGQADPEFTYTVSGICGEDEPVFEGALSRVAGKTVGNYNITLGTLALTEDAVNDNYEIELNATPVTFSITPKTITANFINTEKYYTSSALTPDFNGFTGLEEGDNVGISFTGGNFVGAGDYYKSFELSGADKDNYVLYTSTVPFSILQLAVTYTAKVDSTNNMSVEYDGNQHALTITMTNKQGTDDVGIAILTNATGTASGSYTATLSLTGDKAVNYKFATGENTVTWYISTAGVDYNLFVNAFSGATIEYDGYVHSIIKQGNLPTGYTFDYYVANKVNGEYSITNTSFGSVKEVGNYYVEVRFFNDGDHDPVDSIFRDLIIEKKSITIEWNNYIFTYDGVAHLPEIELNGIINGEEEGVDVVWNISAQVNYTNGVVAKVTGLSGTYANNYKLSGQTQVSMQINKRTIKVTIDAQSSNYGDEIAELTGVVTIGSIVEGDEDVYELSTTATSAKPVGEYAITGEQGDNENYIVTFKSAVYTINARPITVTIDNKSAYYGDAKVALTAVVTGGIVNGDTDVYTLICNITPTSNVNNYWINGQAKNANYDISFVDGIYTINPRPITINYTDEHKSVVYGDEPVWLTLGQEMSSNNFYLVGNNFVNGNSIADSTIMYFNTKADGSGVSFDTVDQTTPAGVYYLMVVGNNANYDFTIALGDQAYLLVQKAPLIIKADNKNMIYGNAVPNFTVTYDGFMLNDDETDLGGELVFACDYEQFDDADNYDIVISGLTSGNYTITFIDGNLYVAPREITVAIANKTSIYGNSIVELTAEVIEGNIVNEDEDVYALSCDVTSLSGVNSYLIGGTATDDNYDITFVNADDDSLTYGIYTITARPIVVTIANKTSVYGDAVVVLTSEVTTSSIVNNDVNVYGLLCEASNTSDVGEYAITGVAGSNVNYSVEFVAGTYTITARPITVTIANKTSVYGNAVVALTSAVTTGNIVNDDENVYSLACQASIISAIGDYPITGTALDDNYAITFVNGIYTITARVVTLTWTNDSFVYDEASHKPTATAGNLANGDVVIVTVSGEQIMAGNYTARATALSNANYAIPVANTHDFVITKPATYDKPIDTEALKENGVDLTNVFKNIDTTSEDAKLELDLGEGAKIEFNKEAIEAIAGNEEIANAVFKFKALDAEEAKAAVKGAAAVFEISLNNMKFEDGKVTVTVDFENKAPSGKEAKLYYVDENGHRTLMKATFADGKLVFDTNHFSTFAVVYELTTVSIILIILAILVVLGGIAFAVIFFMKKKKAGNPAPKADAKPEAKAEPKAEAKSATKPEAKAEAKPMAKPEAKAEPKVEAKKEVKPEANKEAKQPEKKENKK